MGIYKIRVFFLATALSLVCSTQAAWAAGWVQEQDGQWYYEDGQERLTGWNMIDGTWYCLDSRTGAWEPKPQIDPQAACYLLENRLKELGLYQDEEEELLFKVDYFSAGEIKISVGYEEKPQVFHTLNIYEVNRKRGIASPTIGNDDISLW